MQQIARSVALALNNLSRPHRVMLGSLSALTLSIALWQPAGHRHEGDESIAKKIESDVNSLHRITDASEPYDLTTSQPSADLAADDLATEAEALANKEYIVSSGDTLSSILNQYGIDLSEINALAASDPDLPNLRIGQRLSWELDSENQLTSLDWALSRREIRHYSRQPNGAFVKQSQLQQGEWQDSIVKGEVQGNFITSGEQAGLSKSEMAAVVKALQWQMDFRKLHDGDRFSALVSRESLQNKRVQSELQAVHLRSGGKDYYAFRADDGKFYDKNGSGLTKGFLRYPTAKAYRVSSNFNPRRVNPVTGRVTPHHGVDFAMPIGTPVLATGDGEVVVANARGGAAGKYVTLRHGRQYLTRYMHLSRVLVKPGDKVKRGDRIALSGNTGRSTGPHLHFEVWINNQPVNALTAKLPQMEGLTGKNRKTYLAQVAERLAQLKL